MAIDKEYIDSLGDNWMVRTDQDGISFHGFEIAPIGEWNTCPKWDDGPVNDDCTSGGFFGQGPGGYGFAKDGTRFCFCETRGPRIVVGGNKIKVRDMRVVYVGADSAASLRYLFAEFPGSISLCIAHIPDGFQLGNVAGSVNLPTLILPSGFTIGRIGGCLNLRCSVLPKGFSVGYVGSYVDLRDATLQDGFSIAYVGGGLNLGNVELPEGFTVGRVGGNLIMDGATLPKRFTIGAIGGNLNLNGVDLSGGFKCRNVGGYIFTRNTALPGCETEDDIRTAIRGVHR